MAGAGLDERHSGLKAGAHPAPLADGLRAQQRHHGGGGDAAADETIRLAEAEIGSIPAWDLPPKVTTEEPEQKDERRLVVRKPAQFPIVTAAYHIPQTSHAGYYALQVLDTILTSDQSARLHRRLGDRDQPAIPV